MANSFGKIFSISTFGESHGPAIGVIIDGCPAGIPISLEHVQKALLRRRPGQSPWTSPRAEPDQVHCLSGLEQNISLGSPITLLVYNQDMKPRDYDELSQVFRPSHADFTTQVKYGIRASSGGGRSSARETIGRVAAASLAEQVLAHHLPSLQILAYVESIKDIRAQVAQPETLNRELLDQTALRCPDPKATASMIKLIEQAKSEGDSVGGVIRCHIFSCPAGLGAPVFDKLHADLAKAMMSLPATRGFEIGLGFAATQLWGSEHNDAFIPKPEAEHHIGTRSNHSGGIQGGISNGETIVCGVAFKPVASIAKAQDSVNEEAQAVKLEVKRGRHDPCVLPRAVPMVEAMAALVIMDHVLQQRCVRL